MWVFGCDENILSFYFFPIPFSFVFCSFLKSKLARGHGSYVKSVSAGFSMVQKALRGKKGSMSLVFRYFSSIRIYSLPSAPISWNLFSLPVAREPSVALFLWRFTNCAIVLFYFTSTGKSYFLLSHHTFPISLSSRRARFPHAVLGLGSTAAGRRQRATCFAANGDGACCKAEFRGEDD